MENEAIFKVVSVEIPTLHLSWCGYKTSSRHLAAMMKSVFASVVLSLFALVMKAEVVVLNGVYQGKDLYVTNPPTAEGIGFCIFEVLVNGKVTSDEVNSPSFAVDLKAWNFKIGDPLEIVLRCKENCAVKVINPEVIYPNSTFEITTINLNDAGLLTWSTIKETASLPYNIEMFRWNKWVKVGEVQGKGAEGEGNYSFQLYLSSGKNLVRIQQLDHKGAHFTQELNVISSKTPVNIKDLKISKQLEFSAETEYEVYSEFGEKITTGRSRAVDTSKFPKGKYYVNYDDKTGVMVEKK